MSMTPAVDRLGLFVVLTLVVATVACGDRTHAVPPAIGTLERDRIDIVAEAFEPIIEIAVREGDAVSQGDLIVRLDPQLLEVRLLKAQAVVAEAEARLRLAARGPRREAIAEGLSRLAGANGALEAAQSELGRVRRLVQRGLDTPAMLDQAEGRHAEARGRRDEARASLDALLRGTPREELDQARAELATAESAVAELTVMLSRLEIRAPVDGRVDALPLKLGARPAGGATVAVLLATGAPYARIHVPAEVWQQLRPGTVADIRIDGQSKRWTGRVRWISSEASFTPHFALTSYDRGRLSYLAEVDLSDGDFRSLPSGVTVEVLFPDAGEQGIVE